MRADLLRRVRRYFAAQNVLEVQTPCLMAHGVPDPALSSYLVQPSGENDNGAFLQTSPEFAMKRLLAAGSGDIFQIGPVFRGAERGRLHLPEFTMLEWYRLDYDHHRLMDDVEALLKTLIPTVQFSRQRYAQLFLEAFALDPHRASTDELAIAARSCGLEFGAGVTDRAVVLDGLFAHCLSRNDAARAGLFVYDFPIEQAAYARMNLDRASARRFELIVGGLELANGYHELTDADEQRERFRAENAVRERRGLPQIALDESLIAALRHGLPDCAGVALGFDRLMMLCAEADNVNEVVSFAPCS